MGFHRLSKDEARAALTELVAKYEIQRTVVESAGSNYTETEARGEFIDPFLSLLGWDVHNEAGVTQSQRDVILEHAANPETYVAGRPDYRLRIKGRDRLPVEAKKPSVKLATSAKSSVQARSYGWSLSLPAAVLTNFAETVVFDARENPIETEGVDVAVIPGCRITVDEYLSKFDTLWTYLAFENVSVDATFNMTHDYEAPPRGMSPFDQTFLSHFREWRLALADDIAKQNSTFGPAEVGRRTQRLLNALLFLRVCEDRDIWQYERLLRSAQAAAVVNAFKEADRVFNAGLFTVLATTMVSPEVLSGVIAELYWPKTKFAFGVMRPDVLAELYEQYLAERVDVASDRTATLVEKPELTHSGGVIPTPQFIVDSLTHSALDKYLHEPGKIPRDLKILDPACGSGVFLLAAFQRLLLHTELAQDSTISSRGKIAKEHLFGVDIDGEAVEVTRLSLLLSILGEARVDVRTDVALLPDLAANIQVGNAVVSTDFDTKFPTIAAIPIRRAAVSQFSWNAAFPEVMGKGGFSVVLANPPYVRIQILQKYLPDHLAYFQDTRSQFGSGRFSFDLSMIFIERSLSLLRPGGDLAMIVPHSFTSAEAGVAVRELLGKRLHKMVHFGVHQVFPGRQTYTALIFAGDASRDDAVLEIVADLNTWKAGNRGSSSMMKRSALTGAPWPIASDIRSKIFETMQANAISVLGDDAVADVYVGVQTSANQLYFFEPNGVQPYPDLVCFTDYQGKTWSIERGIVRPSLLDRRLSPYDISPDPDGFGIFPYTLQPAEGKKKARAVPISPEVMEQKFPRAFAYFNAHRARFLDRNISPNPGEAFWAYGRSQNLLKIDAPKVIIRTMSLTPQYVSDPNGLLVSGGGHGGPYTLLRVPNDGLYPEEVIIAIASHPATDAFVASRGKAYRGSYLIHTKATLSQMPIPHLALEDVEEIVRAVGEMQAITKLRRTESDSVIATSLIQRTLNLRATVESIISSAFGLSDDDMVAITG